MNYKHFSLRDRANELLAKSSSPCGPKKTCALLQACLDASAERRNGIAREQFISGDGKRSGTRVVIWIRGREYAEMSFCPFCGEKLENK